MLDARARRRRSLRLPTVAACMAALGACAPGAASAAVVKKVSAVAYGRAQVNAPAPGRARLLLDLYRPAQRAKRPRPIVVVIHGGGFTMQSRADEGIVRVARSLASRGIVAASIDYRLLGTQPVPSRRVAPLVSALPRAPLFNAMACAVDDTLTAIDYLRAHRKKLRIDMKRLGLVGSSAGAITADHVAYTLDDHGIRRPEIEFVGSLWGGIFVPPPTGRGTVGAIQLERREAALFAVHGDTDTRVPVSLSDDLVARARAQRVHSEYHRIPGGGHGYDQSQFFTRKVVGSQTPFDRLVRFARSELR